MNEQNIQQQIDDINRKLDIILEEMEFQRRHRGEMEDLKDDLMRVGKDVYHTAVVELEDVHDYLKTGDVMYLGKKLLRNVNTLTQQSNSSRVYATSSTTLRPSHAKRLSISCTDWMHWTARATSVSQKNLAALRIPL